jgi:hypothetical protein
LKLKKTSKFNLDDYPEERLGEPRIDKEEREAKEILAKPGKAWTLSKAA